MIEQRLPLRDFRAAHDLSLDEVSARLGVHKTTVMRLESGELPSDADMVERIAQLTGGAIAAAEMHAVRLAWLKANRPERFAGPAGGEPPTGGRPDASAEGLRPASEINEAAADLASEAAT